MSLRTFFPTIWSADGNGARDPFSTLRQEVDRVFDNFGRSLPSLTWPQDAVVPKVNVIEKDKTLEVTVELPGVEMKDVELLVDEDILTIKGEKRHEQDEKTAEHHLHECSYGAFSRSIQLPFDVEPKTVAAGFKNGVLTVTIPVPAHLEPKAKRIEIRPGA